MSKQGVAVAAENISKRIRRLRLERGLTLQQVANAVGLHTPAAVSHWESGRTEPTPDRLLALSRLLDVSVDDLRGSAVGRSPPPRQRDDNAEIDAILADAERRIARLLGRESGQVTVLYEYRRRG